MRQHEQKTRKDGGADGMKKVIVAGHICLDVTPIFPQEEVRCIDDILKPGRLINMENVLVSTGGSVANTGLALKILGADVSLMGKIGDDDFGKLVLNVLDKYQESEGMLVCEGERTSYSVVLAIPGIGGADMKEFVEYVNHPLFHACWDTGHAHIEGIQYDEILALGNELYALHVNDNRGEKDEHMIPFFGTISMDEVMHALIDSGYQGYFTMEAGSCLRSANYWLGKRYQFKKDNRLAQPQLFMQKQMEKLMYEIGVYILKSYDCYEE